MNKNIIIVVLAIVFVGLGIFWLVGEKKDYETLTPPGSQNPPPAALTPTPTPPQSSGTPQATGSPSPTQSPIATVTPTPQPTTIGQSLKTITVEILDSGFSPKQVTLKSKDSILWINKSSRSSWPASDPHPMHTRYPILGGCSSSAFDACKPIKSGENWSFTFTETGTWAYHDHLAPGLTGTVTVQ